MPFHNQELIFCDFLFCVEDCGLKKVMCRTFPYSHVSERICVSCSHIYSYFPPVLEYYMLYLYIYLDFVY